MCSPNNSNKSLSLTSFQHIRSSDFFEIAPKAVVFGVVAVGAFDVVDDDNTDDDISDVVVVAVGLNLLLVLVVFV